MTKLRLGVLTAITAMLLMLVGMVSHVQAQVTRPFATGFQVQNLGSTDADITITFYNTDGSEAANASDTVAGNGQKTYAVLSDVPDANLPTGFNGSAVISSSERVAAIVNVVSPDISLGFGGEAYVGFESGATEVSLPLLFKDFAGFNTFFNVQNVSETQASVTVTYSGGGLGSPVTEGPVTIQPGAARRFDQNANGDLPTGFNGSAIVTSDQEIVAAAVQVGPDTVFAYNGFVNTSTEPVFPLVNSNNAGFFTGISLQNTGDTATEVTVSYTPSPPPTGAGSACTETITIPAQDSRFFALEAFSPNPAAGYEGQNDCANGSTFVGSARVTANSANQPLVAIVNQLGAQKGGAYASFDPSVGSGTVVYPLIQDSFFGFFTGISIVNVGASATTITCSYSNTSATQVSESVQPGGTFTPVQAGAIADQYNGSGTCTASGGQIIGIANQVSPGAANDSFFVYEGVNN